MLVPNQCQSVARQRDHGLRARWNAGLLPSQDPQPPCAEGWTLCKGPHNSLCCSPFESCWRDPHDNYTAKCELA